MHDPQSKNIQTVFGEGPSLIKANDVQLAANIDSGEISIVRCISQISYLCGVTQNMSFFLSRESAKFVPMLSVAGSAGGTTMVIKSKARTIIKRHANWDRSVFE